MEIDALVASVAELGRLPGVPTPHIDLHPRPGADARPAWPAAIRPDAAAALPPPERRPRRDLPPRPAGGSGDATAQFSGATGGPVIVAFVHRLRTI
jgi:hypothetical protein